jgi:hypothetical protein
MAGDEVLQTYPSPDGRRWLELRKRPDGLFYFQEFREADDEADDNVPAYGAQTFTSPGWKSGTYKSVQAAEDDLQKMAPWLSEKSS